MGSWHCYKDKFDYNSDAESDFEADYNNEIDFTDASYDKSTFHFPSSSASDSPNQTTLVVQRLIQVIGWLLRVVLDVCKRL